MQKLLFLLFFFLLHFPTSNPVDSIGIIGGTDGETKVFVSDSQPSLEITDPILAEPFSQNEEVQETQEILQALNHDFVPLSGELEELTQEALLYWKEIFQLEPLDGSLTEKTKELLFLELQNRYQKNTDSIVVLANKTHYLPSSYEPSDLITPDVPFCIGEMQMREEAAKQLEAMFQAAKEEGVHLIARSGYRSYNTQKMVFQRNVDKNGLQKALTYSARPGQSEHQTGLAMDITSKDVNYLLVESFEETEAFHWLQEHAQEYGFILRYPKDRTEETGYQYEPWHFRYVGTFTATYIKENQLILEDYIIQ